MENTDIESIVQNLFAAIPVIHRKLTCVLDEGVGPGLSHHHFALLGILSKTGALPVSEIGRRLMISRPQMTAVIDKLTALDLVTRTPDTEDRRIVRISITINGRTMLGQAVEMIKKNVEKKLSGLSTEDIELLSTALRNIKTVGSKIE